MNSFFNALVLSVIFFCQLSASELPKIGVSQFKNLNSEGESQHLSIVLNSTLESALNQRYQIPIVERALLGDLLSEEQLQTNAQNFEILPIDFLLVGSFSGNESSLSVIIKLLDAKSTLSTFQIRLTGDLETIMEQLYDVAFKISSQLKGESHDEVKGFLSIKGGPKGATIYKGNRLIGTIPLIESPFIVGTHEFTIKKEGYESQVREVQILESQSQSIEVKLDQAREENFFNLGLSFNHLGPINSFDNGQELGNFQLMNFILARQFGSWNLMFRTGGSQFLAADGNSVLSYEWEVPSDVNPVLNERRRLELMHWSTVLQYSFFQDSPHFSPYVGLGGGFIWLFDRSVNSSWYDDEVATYRSPFYQLELGLKLLPNSPFGVNLNVSYVRTTKEIPFSTIQSVDQFGEVEHNTYSDPLSLLGLGLEIVGKIGG